MIKQDKTKEIFGLNKLPDEAIIKQLKFDIGVLKSTIDELNFDLKKANDNALLYEDKDKVIKLINKNSDLTNKLKSKDKKLLDIQERLRSLCIENNIIKKQLFEYMKKDIKDKI